MAIDADPRTAPSGSLAGRLTRGRVALLAATVVFALLVSVGALSVVHGLIGWAVIVVAALISGGRDADAIAVANRSADMTRAASDRIIEAAIAGLPDPVIVIDRQAIVVTFNAHAAALAPALAPGEPASFALRVPDVVEAMRRAAATGRSERVEFFERIPADRWSEAFITPIVVGSDPARELMLVTLHDLTPIRRVEEMRADFVANASHELRTPLASLAGFIETLQGPAREDAQARDKFLGIMKAQANRMARLIDDLLSLSRIELKAHVQPQTLVDLVAIVRQVADGLQMLARDRGVEIKLHMPTTPLTVRGDRDELIRVFENLIENALKYGAAGKRVEVSASREPAHAGAEAIVAVHDFGPGIAPEHLPRLTERFYRVDVVESRAQGGTGLGLALVKHIVNRHRGRISIDSTLGQGATFSIRLPIVQETAAKEEIKAKS